MTLRLPFALATFAALAFAIGGCEDEVDPTLGTDQAFSLYGYLDPTASRQAIRVVPIAEELDAQADEPLPATITSTELGTGRSVTWRDSVVTFLDGSTGYVAVADYTPTPGERVRFTVQETDGEQRATTVEIQLPTLGAIGVERTSQDASGVGFRVSFDDAPRLLSARLRFLVTGLPAAPTDTTTLEVDDPLDIERVDGGWEVPVPLVQIARSYLAAEGLSGLRLIEVRVAGFVASDGWDVGSLGDDSLVEPGTFSNVTGGFGFIGAGYEGIARWVPSLSTQAQAGFTVDRDPASVLFINEVSQSEQWVELYNPSFDGINLSGYRIHIGEDGDEDIISGFVPPGGFFVINTVTPIRQPNRIWITRTDGSIVLGRDVDLPFKVPPTTWGSWPDGRTFIPFRDQPDIFAGPLVPTPGEPNVLPPVPPIALNEVYTEGDGAVEVYVDPSLTDDEREFVRVKVGSQDRTVFEGPRAFDVGTAFRLAAESASNGLDLGQLGGEVYVYATVGVRNPKGATITFDRVIDVHTYGPQVPGRSTGRVPDGPGGAWTDGLMPTLGTANTGAGRSPLSAALGR